MSEACRTAVSSYRGIDIADDGRAALIQFATDQGAFQVEIPQQDLHLLAARAVQLCEAGMATAA